jgi:hypothetical protein
VFSENQEEVFAQYGLEDRTQRTSVDNLWKAHFRENPALKQEWERRYWHYHEYWKDVARRAARYAAKDPGE